ncbi:RNA 2',3'-cyclic phosphodiesterase [Streptomyces sp. PmtG]
MRLFLAVLPPEPVVAELAARVDDLKRLPGAGALRWTERAGWHLTLAFLGEVDDAAVPALEARLETAARHTEPFALALRGGGRFGERALWAGVSGQVSALRLLAGRVEGVARAEGLAVNEARAFHPHLTLARGRGEVDLGDFVEALGSFVGAVWEVREVALVRSGARYETVGVWGFPDPAPSRNQGAAPPGPP